MKKLNRTLNLILPIIVILAIFLIWEIASRVIGSEYVLPSVGQTLNSLFALFLQNEFYVAFALTFSRSLIAFLISFILGFALAFIRSRFALSAKIIEPIISILRALPTIAIILLLLFWTNSKVAPVIVTMLVVLPTVYTHLVSAFEEVNKNAVEAGRVDGATEKQIFAYIEFPQIAPTFYKAIGSGISLNFKLMVAAEVLAQTARSIGYLLNTSKVYFEIATMMALVLISVAVGVVIELIFNKIAQIKGEWR
ncbi:MAG: ABC transporter permease subunit [Clostridia bacterium]|nr:ABC transporter permease subunit [Clostridia bacterium]